LRRNSKEIPGFGVVAQDNEIYYLSLGNNDTWGWVE